ncbi:MAG: helix-turn-helix domain-containing protein [Bacteroidota bacterium]|nr:helix-turn-helix domain-containing protein [Bacteroidota bacterium]MDP4216784.1 helix-turn-helix domain-containing protein [Bacteroidota bacterium]MDP4245359.1 helix-turn-helix domain-containing protein [Bacteroidota bacterium]MDP4252636.1 helix-turn-helix domain-containing protein [Bacteroidota bacterium]MDP4258501.1 helix-turn-helix domain-containing protein [Bacteroidota bacterium]
MKQEVTKTLPALKRRTDVQNKRCAVIATLKIFSTKWKPCIICYLSQGSMRYNELYRMIPNISRKMLSGHLRELESDQILVRIQHDAKKQRVEYGLSETGRSLLGILDRLQNWGLEHLTGVLSIGEMLALTK